MRMIGRKNQFKNILTTANYCQMLRFLIAAMRKDPFLEHFKKPPCILSLLLQSHAPTAVTGLSLDRNVCHSGLRQTVWWLPLPKYCSDLLIHQSKRRKSLIYSVLKIELVLLRKEHKINLKNWPLKMPVCMENLNFRVLSLKTQSG